MTLSVSYHSQPQALQEDQRYSGTDRRPRNAGGRAVAPRPLRASPGPPE